MNDKHQYSEIYGNNYCIYKSFLANNISLVNKSRQNKRSVLVYKSVIKPNAESLKPHKSAYELISVKQKAYKVDSIAIKKSVSLDALPEYISEQNAKA